MTEIQELHGKNGAADVAKTRRMEEMLCKIGQKQLNCDAA